MAFVEKKDVKTGLGLAIGFAIFAVAVHLFVNAGKKS